MSHIQYQLPFPSTQLTKRMDGLKGLQYSAPSQHVPAIADGFVVHVQGNTSIGNIIVLSHEDGFFTIYGGLKLTPKSFVGKFFARNQSLGMIEDNLTLILSNNKYGWMVGNVYDPILFVRERLRPSTRTSGHEYSIATPDKKVWESITESLLRKSLLTSSDDTAVMRQVQVLVSNFTPDIVFDGVGGRYTAIGVQRFINWKGETVDVDGHLTKEQWALFAAAIV